MRDITLKIKLYGAFRKFGDSVNLCVVSGSNMDQVKEALSKELGELVHDSALANDNAILPKSYVFEQNAMLSILPPVCGG